MYSQFISRFTLWFLAALFATVFAPSAYATCTGSSPSWTCDASGTADQNGQALWDLLNNDTPVCGDTITLTHGGAYNNILSSGAYYAFRLKHSCAANNPITIKSDDLASLPAGTRIAFANRSHMPKLIANGGPIGGTAALLDFWGGCGGYTFQGIWFTTSANMTATNTMTQMSGNTTQSAYSGIPLSSYEHDVIFDRVLVMAIEEETYGNMSTTLPAAGYFRGFSIGLNLDGQNITVRDSYISAGAYDPTTKTTITITSATNANPAVLTATGIATTFALDSGIAECSTGPTVNCYSPGSGLHGARIVIFAGATGSWATINGPALVVYASANTVTVWKSTPAAFFAGNPGGFDSTSLGALTGTLTATLAIPKDPVYVTQCSSACVNFSFINNLFENGAMAMFFGGGNSEPTSNVGIVQAGSTSTSIILNTVAGLNVGDYLMAQAASVHSVYCTSSAKRCWGGGSRTGQVTAINNATATATVIPVGFDGFDVAPTVGGFARWDGRQAENVQIRRNTVLRPSQLPFNGKGYLEFKTCNHCIIDGNILTDSPAGNWFLEAKGQGGYDPWNKGEMRFSNNLVGGTYGSPSGLVMQGQDDEGTSVVSTNVYFENNILPEMISENMSTANPFAPAGTAQNGSGVTGGGWLHNTMFAKASSPAHYAYVQGGCLPASGSEANYLYGNNILENNNLFSFGEGIQTTSCWVNQSTSVNGNVFLADGSVNAAGIVGLWPTNLANDTFAGIKLVGSCTYAAYTNCALDPTSTYRGTATDGADPGADVPQVTDRINGWSDLAGLLAPNFTSDKMEITWAPSTTTSSPVFTIFDVIGNCSAHLYTNPIRTTEHADTSGSSACNRSGNTVVGSLITFVFGHNSPLTPVTTYYYKITDGSRIMVGNFTTIGGGGGLGGNLLTGGAIMNGGVSK